MAKLRAKPFDELGRHALVLALLPQSPKGANGAHPRKSIFGRIIHNMPPPPGSGIPRLRNTKTRCFDRLAGPKHENTKHGRLRRVKNTKHETRNNTGRSQSLQLSRGCPPSLSATAPGVGRPRALYIFYLAGSSPSTSTIGDRAHATSATGPLLPGHARDPTSVIAGTHRG